ncbi:START domain-containing protein [Puia dinghuensis]|uniref:START domain-containing protein n=1 Tax=Puia dinghuensis TaxID=1792502 RepID=A0A8J2UDH9_9BACT|nr:START domain-containing protein [Puia dinghuensis]GGB00824.1 hypothetical protein GCM10011511_25140 [Puia dinghuensis]
MIPRLTSCFSIASRFIRAASLIAIAVLLLAAGITAHAQSDWELRTEKKALKVYTRTFPGSKFKAIKVELELDATLSQLVAVILDVKTATEWVYAAKSAVLIKQVSPAELYYYSEVRLPWPLSNRDFIARLIVSQDPYTRVVTIDGPTVPDLVPEKKDIVRVKQSEGRWIITPVAKNHIRVEYTLRTDPGGDIPAWLFNLFVTRGPVESFENLQQQLKKPVYSNVKLPFIVEYLE